MPPIVAGKMSSRLLTMKVSFFLLRSSPDPFANTINCSLCNVEPQLQPNNPTHHKETELDSAPPKTKPSSKKPSRPKLKLSKKPNNTLNDLLRDLQKMEKLDGSYRYERPRMMKMKRRDLVKLVMPV